MSTVSWVAGSLATVIFAASTLPMLVKAARTRDLSSYSRGNLVMANAGNAVYSFYVFGLPPGPVWMLHTFYVVSSALMLGWSLRWTGRRQVTAGPPPAAPLRPVSHAGDRTVP